MGFWDKSLRIFKSLCDNGTQSVRQLAQQTVVYLSPADKYPRLTHR